MGILKAVIASVESTFGDQWKELFYCEALPDTTLIVRGQKYVSRYAENTNGNTIRDGSIICCADGQCAFYLALLYVLDGLGYHMAIVRQFLLGQLTIVSCGADAAVPIGVRMSGRSFYRSLCAICNT